MMKIIIHSQNTYKNRKLGKKKFENTAKKLLEYYLTEPKIYDFSCLKNRKYNSIELNILFCSKEQTHLLNKQYRNKDSAADIITFAFFADSPEEEKIIVNKKINLGEIIIAVDKAECEAAKKEITTDEELNFLISHGIMHLLGFDHQTQKDYNFVIKYQKKALESMGIKYDKI